MSSEYENRRFLPDGSKTPTYSSWSAMKSRCYYENNIGYDNYGGRGITVCKKWIDSFDAFYEDMGPRAAGYSLDRVDNEGSYCPDNCRWATSMQQAHNRRPKSNTTGYYVTFQKPKIFNRFQLRIWDYVDKKRIHIGYFSTRKDADLAGRLIMGGAG